jgi:excisionase family DNA binding protein
MSAATAKNESSLQNPEKDQRVSISETDQQEIKQLYEAIRRGKAKLVGPNGEARPLPDSLYSFLIELISLLNEGKSVYIIQNQAKLTTIEAAAMIGVSRQFLINLLEKNEIPYHMVGTHRRIYAQDLVQYKAKRDENRSTILSDLAKAEADEGLYDRLPSPDED